MTDLPIPASPDRFRFLATFIAGRSVDVAEAPAGQAAHTNGQVIFVSAGRSVAEQRREMLVQSALLGAGSLDPRLVKALRARPSVARRYLALEGHRVLAELADQLPLAAALRPDGEPSTATADESLEVAKGRAKSPSRRSGSVSSSPPGCWRLPPDRARRPPTKTCAWSSISSTCPRPTTTTRTTTAVRGKQDPQAVRKSALQLTSRCRTSSARCSAVHVPRGRRRRRGAAGSLDSAGARSRTECPAAAHPDPIHR